MHQKHYSKQFKVDDVTLGTEQDYKVSETARKFGIRHSSLWRWIEQFESNGNQAFPGKGNLSYEKDELYRLRKEIRKTSLRSWQSICRFEYQKILEQYGMVCSMSRKGDCWDNAIVENFPTPLKLNGSLISSMTTHPRIQPSEDGLSNPLNRKILYKIHWYW